MALNVKSGTYTGDASDPKTISGIGFIPKVVIIGANAGTGDPSAALYKTTDMTTGSSGVTVRMGENGQNTTGEIDTMSSGQFTVRGQKNLNGVNYYYLALGGDDVVTGTYTGNASDNRDITGIGFQPEWVVIEGHPYHSVHKCLATGASTDKTQYFTDVANLSNAIQALISDGFQVGTANEVNANGVTYYYFAIKQGSGVKSGTYTGNATDDRDITSVGLNPISVLIKNSLNQQAAFRSGESGDLSSLVRYNTAPISNAIQSLGTNSFQIGTSATVNSNGEEYFWIAFENIAETTSFTPIIIQF